MILNGPACGSLRGAPISLGERQRLDVAERDDSGIKLGGCHLHEDSRRPLTGIARS